MRVKPDVGWFNKVSTASIQSPIYWLISTEEVRISTTKKHSIIARCLIKNSTLNYIFYKWLNEVINKSKCRKKFYYNCKRSWFQETVVEPKESSHFKFYEGVLPGSWLEGYVSSVSYEIVDFDHQSVRMGLKTALKVNWLILAFKVLSNWSTRFLLVRIREKS